MFTFGPQITLSASVSYKENYTIDLLINDDLIEVNQGQKKK